MRVVRHLDPTEFWQRVSAVLLRNEAENCLPIGIAHTLIHEPERYRTFHLFSVQDGEHVLGAGWMTPPHPLGLTALPAAAIPLVVEHARSLGDSVSSLVGPKDTAIAFKDAWLAVVGGSVKSTIAQRIFRLSSLVTPPEVEGAMRLAAEPDRALLEDWHLAFIVDCGLTGNRQQAVDACDRGLKKQSLYVWHVGPEPVAMVGCIGPTPSGIRVGWVYTPPERRRRGYATALVAEASKKQLEQGRKFCFLYTDLANPTSNGIYQKIGYQPVSDSMHFIFA